MFSLAVQVPRISTGNNTSLRVVFSTGSYFSVFAGYPDETLSLVFDILPQHTSTELIIKWSKETFQMLLEYFHPLIFRTTLFRFPETFTMLKVN